MKLISFISLVLFSSASFGQARELLGRDTSTHTPGLIIRDTNKTLSVDTTLRIISQSPYGVTIGINPNYVSASSGNSGGGSLPGWQLTGNAATPGRVSGSFLGTTNNVSLRFKTNGADRGGIDSTGSWFTDSTVSNGGYRLNVGGTVLATGGVAYTMPSGSAFRGRDNGATLYMDAGADLGGIWIFRSNNNRFGGNTYYGNTFTVPNSTVQIGGSFATNVAKSTPPSSYGLGADYTVSIDASAPTTGTNVNATLPTAVGIQGRIYTIKKSDVSSNTVTVTTSNSQLIDGASTYVLASRYKYVTVQSDNIGWMVIGQN